LSTYLDKIIDTKKKELEDLSLLERERERSLYDPVESLRKKPFITEIKKASPSAGEINKDVDILRQSRTYEENGAGAISILTDAEYFNGSIDDLSSVAEAVDIPLLCKDFIISEIQVENAYRAGADFILLIAAVLDENELDNLSLAAKSYGLKALYEIHGIEEFKKIEKLTPELVGVNSRNLKTFSVEKEKAAGVIGDLRKEGDFLVVAESGIENSGDVRSFREAGADAFLIGTALMKAGTPAEKLKEFYMGL
jgi:indole-3-glycerol phosphate synthase